MSLEQAILEHASALREVALAIQSMGVRGALGTIASASPADLIAAAQPDAELEEAVTKVEQKAQTEKKAEVAPPAEVVKEMTVAEVQAELVYTTDVKPTLLKLNKEKGRDALAGLLKKYNAPNGDKIQQGDLALILADAEALLAA